MLKEVSHDPVLRLRARHQEVRPVAQGSARLVQRETSRSGQLWPVGARNRVGLVQFTGEWSLPAGRQIQVV